jgi:enediyne biosynthesis protein E4
MALIAGLVAIPPATATEAAKLPHFADVTSKAGISVTGLGNSASWVDIDGDGVLDLFVTDSDFPGQVYLYRGNGDGTFKDVTTKAGFADWMLRSVSWGDYDGDGHVDLVATSYASGSRAYLFHNKGDGTFKEVGAKAGLKGSNIPWRVVFEDYDQDGLLDIYQANFGANFLYHNNGDGTFSDVAAKAGVSDPGRNMDATWADFNGDGRPDLFVATEGADHVFRNRGDGTFADATKRAKVSDADASESACWSDYDGDGRPDLYVVDIEAASNHLYHNDGAGRFTDVTAKAGVGDVGDGRTCGWVDVDGDGRLDLYASDHINDTRLFRNLGSGRFKDVAPQVGIALPFDVFDAAGGDFDGDGDPDLFEVGHDGNVLLRNDGPPGAFIQLLLRGTVSNTTGIGAIAWTERKGLQLLRRLDGANGAYGQNSPAMTFGVGASKGPFDFTVLWPSGIVQTVTGVLPGQIVYVVESG